MAARFIYGKTNQPMAQRRLKQNFNEVQAILDAVGQKVDKIEGKGLSANDYTDQDKNKLASVEEDAQENVIEVIESDGVELPIENKTVRIPAHKQSDWSQNDSSGKDYIKNRTHWEENGVVHKLHPKFLDMDASPTSGSTKPVISGGVKEALDGKQDVISDIADIRHGAGLGETAYQKPSAGIPASDLAAGVIPDVSGFITRTVNDLANYYLKSETYTKEEVAALISAIRQFHYEVYAALPATGEGNVLYLIGPTGSGSDKYEEYVYANNGWVKIGDTSIDLSGYVTIEALDQALSGYVTSAALATALAGKVGSETIHNIVELTQAEYDALQTKRGDTMYITTDTTKVYIGSRLIKENVKANEEDIDFDSSDKLQFADRVYNSSTPDGLGYVILRKNKTFAQQVTATNTVYEIRYDFDLNAASVTVPAGCVLKFNGGKLTNGTLVGTLTTISADPVQIFSGVALRGSFDNMSITAEWYGCKADGQTDNHDSLQAACDNAIQIGAAVRLLPGVYVIDESKGAIYIRFSADGQKFELRGAGSQFTTIKTADGSIDRVLARGADPRYMHTFYHIPAYGGVYNVSYAAESIEFIGITFDKNKRGTTASPSSAYAWESNNIFYSVNSFNSKTGTVERYHFEDIVELDKPGSGISFGNNPAKEVVLRRIVDLQETNDWGYREGIYPLFRCDNVTIEECDVRFIQIEPTTSQEATHRSHVRITNSRLGALEWNRPGSAANDSLSVSGCVFDNAYINLSGAGNIVFDRCVLNFTDRNKSNTIWNSPHFTDCTFNFFWDADGYLPNINHRRGNPHPIYTRCSFFTDDIPESPKASQSIFNNSTTASHNSHMTFRDCVFDVKINYYLNGMYAGGHWHFFNCKITMPATQQVFQVGSYASGWGAVDAIDCEFVNDNVIYVLAVPTSDPERGKISGRYTRTNILTRLSGTSNIGLDGSDLILDLAAGTALNVRLPQWTRIFKDGIIYTVLKDEESNETITVTPAYYKCEFVNKFMTTAEREALTGLPAIPIEAYDTTLNKPYFWTGAAWTDNPAVTPVEATQPAGGFAPNVVYNLGELAGDTTFTLAAATDNTILNHYYWAFDTPATAPTITWPTGLTWVGGTAPTIEASTHYEISVIGGVAAYLNV